MTDQGLREAGRASAVHGDPETLGRELRERLRTGELDYHQALELDQEVRMTLSPERVVVIQWNPDGTVHSLEITDRADASRLDTVDVNWHDGQGFSHRSGGGPGPDVFLNAWADGKRGKLWAAPEITFTRWVGRDGLSGEVVPIARENLGELGIDLVEEFPGDPRPDLIEGDGYCCEQCDAWFPYDDPCPHGEAWPEKEVEA